jgi:hypothetical protein
MKTSARKCPLKEMVIYDNWVSEKQEVFQQEQKSAGALDQGHQQCSVLSAVC